LCVVVVLRHLLPLYVYVSVCKRLSSMKMCGVVLLLFVPVLCWLCSVLLL